MGGQSHGSPCGSETLHNDLTYRTRVRAIGAVDFHVGLKHYKKYLTHRAGVWAVRAVALHVGLKHYSVILHTGHEYGRSELWICMWVSNITQ